MSDTGFSRKSPRRSIGCCSTSCTGCAEDMHPVHGGQLDDATLRRVFGCFPSGVIAVCASVDGEPLGMAASSFTTVSVAPPLVSICVQNSSTTWPRLRRRERLGISVLAEHHGDACLSL